MQRHNVAVIKTVLCCVDAPWMGLGTTATTARAGRPQLAFASGGPLGTQPRSGFPWETSEVSGQHQMPSTFIPVTLTVPISSAFDASQAFESRASQQQLPLAGTPYDAAATRSRIAPLSSVLGIRTHPAGDTGVLLSDDRADVAFKPVV